MTSDMIRLKQFFPRAVTIVLAVTVIALDAHAQLELQPTLPWLLAAETLADQTESLGLDRETDDSILVSQLGTSVREMDDTSAQFEASRNQGGSLDAGSFPVEGLDQRSRPGLANNFNAIPEFDSGIVVFGRSASLKIGGYVKADLIYDLDAIESTDSFDTTSILTTGEDRKNARFHARQSRLSFDTRWPTSDDTARAFIEGDFFGGSPVGNSSFRLRHAYGSLGGFTAGQTWTTFTDPSAVPQTLDMEGAVSNVNRRQGLVRWQQPIWRENVSLAVAVENPDINVEAPSLVSGQGRTKSPDLITRLRIEPEWSEFQAAFVLRELGFQPDNQAVITGTAWGFNLTGSGLLLDRTKAYYQITFGEGIGSYRGSPDVVATGPNTAAILPMFGWMVGVHQEWNSRLTSNLSLSKLSLDDLPGQDPANLHKTSYFAVNLIANPYEHVFCGIEYLHGFREDVGGASGTARRIQTSFGFFLP